MYDTFHANIEEKDPVAAIKTIRKHMIHFHISENDRGTPGKGHVPWDETYKALRKAKYDGWLTIEAFGRANHFRRWRRQRAFGGDFYPNTGRGLQVRLQEHEAGLGQSQVKRVYVIGTCDTKEAELRYAVERVQGRGCGWPCWSTSRRRRARADAEVTPEMVASITRRGPMPCWGIPTGAAP